MQGDSAVPEVITKCYVAVCPPSTNRSAPVMNELASESRYIAGPGYGQHCYLRITDCLTSELVHCGQASEKTTIEPNALQVRLLF